MSDERLFSLRNRWFTVSVGATIALLIFSVVVGFVWLPSAQRDAQFRGIWNSICSAAGVPRKWLAAEPLDPAWKVSTVEVTPHLLAYANQLSIGRGATLALRCTMCHGERGMSQANSPNLAGQYAIVIYKQLRDFATGARQNAVMSPMVRSLTDQDMRDLSAYYAYLPRPAPTAQSDSALAGRRSWFMGRRCATFPRVPRVMAALTPRWGVRGWWTAGGVFEGPTASVRCRYAAQRDITGQMRNIARNMTPEEIAAAADWYASLPH
jgi:cytochrome c553